MTERRGAEKLEFGDFQTPTPLAEHIVTVLKRRGTQPLAILEPTAGRGNLLFAATDAFRSVTQAVGLELHPPYVAHARGEAAARGLSNRVRIDLADIFSVNLKATVSMMQSPLLVIGNPPWVTSAVLGGFRSTNIPTKSNFQKHVGLDAVTGKSNFDVSEWIILKVLDAIAGRDATIAMLCKASVARKVVRYCAQRRIRVGNFATYSVDASRHFDASVEAVLLVCESSTRTANYELLVFDHLDATQPSRRLALAAEAARFVDVLSLPVVRSLAGESPVTWRSGVKHDCASVMELRNGEEGFHTAAGERLELEQEYVYPLLKSSDLAKGNVRTSRCCVILTQTRIGEETGHLARDAPQLWRYLISHTAAFEGRRSSIYRGKPRFSIFGVGDYTFAPWKVAISGLYKSLAFQLVGPIQGKPTVFDDTCYFLPFKTEAFARAAHSLLRTEEASAFLHALISWSDKRPVTKEVLNNLDIGALARLVGRRIAREADGGLQDALKALAAMRSAGESQTWLGV